MTQMDPSDPFSYDMDSPDSPYFPYGACAEVVAIWHLEVIRQIRRDASPANLDRYAEDMAYIFVEYGDEIREMIEYNLEHLKEQFADDAADVMRQVDELMAGFKRDIDLYSHGRT